jgi:pimeloyl-ACP methyl ester carboxylesterase
MWGDLGYVAALRDDYRLVLIDQRGFGASDKPHQPGAYDLDAMASDVIAVLDDLGIPQAHIWGYSMGARIAWGLAHFHRERCRSLIIGADFPFEPDPAEPMPEWMRGQVEMLQHGQESFVTALMSLFAPWLKLEWDWAERLAGMDLQALMAQRAIPRRVGLLQALPGLDVPCLLYAGDQDPYLGFLEGWVKRLGNASLVALPSTTHPQGIFERDLIVPHVRAFLAGVEEAGQAA